MKRLLSLLLSLLLVCSIAYPNALASQMIDTSDAGTLRLYSAGDTILAQGDRLYRWDASAQTLAALALPEDARLSLLASDGATFYGLDAAGTLFILTLTGNEVALTPLAQLDFAGVELTAPRQALVSQGNLYVIDDPGWGDPDQPTPLWRFALDTGEGTLVTGAGTIAQLVLGEACCYALTYQMGVPMLNVFDLNTGKVGASISLPKDCDPAGLAWDAPQKALLLVSHGRIYRVGENLAPALVGYASVRMTSAEASAAMDSTGQYLLAARDRLLVCGIGDAAADAPLKVCANLEWPDATGVRDFQQKTGVMIAYQDNVLTDSADYLTSFLSGDPQDVYTADDPALLRALMEKGYCLDLSGSETIAALFDGMEPSIAASMMKDGHIYAVPHAVSFSRSCVGCSPEVMAELGLTEDELPRTIGDFMDFLTEHADDTALEEQGMALFQPFWGFSSLREALLNMIVEQQFLACEAQGEALHFDGDELLTLLNQLDQITPLLPEVPAFDTKCLFNASDYTPLNDNNGGCDGYRLWGFSLSEDTPAYLGVNVQPLFVYAGAEQPEQAVQLLESMVEHLDLTTRATLLPDARQPVENPDYATYAESYAADKARYESLIAAASDEGERRRLQDLWQEDEADWQRRLTQGRYLLSPETIAAYTDFAPQLCPLREVSMLTAESGFSALHHRFLDGQLSAQEYMQAVQRVLRMMALEE